MENARDDMRARREIFREGDIPVLEVSIGLPQGEELPAGIAAYYRSLREAYARQIEERILPAARAALLALPEQMRRFGFRRYRLTVRCRTEVCGGYLLVSRTTALTSPAGIRHRETCEVFTLPGGRLTPPLVFLRTVAGALPRATRRYRRADMTVTAQEAVLTAARGRQIRVQLPENAFKTVEAE